MNSVTTSFVRAAALVLATLPLAGCTEDAPPDEPDCAQGSEECLEDEDCCEGLSCQWGSCGACAPEGERCDMSPECCAGLVCTGARCEPAFGRDYEVLVDSAALSTSHDGVLWDADESEAHHPPDPYVLVTIDDQVFETSVVQDSIFPNFQESFQARIDAGDDFRVALYDADEGEDELVIEYPGRVPASLPVSILRQGGLEVRAQSEGFTAVIRLGFFPQ